MHPKKQKTKDGDALKVVDLDKFEDREIAKARKLVEKELEHGVLPSLVFHPFSCKTHKTPTGCRVPSYTPEEFDEMWSTAFEQYLISNGQTITKEGASNNEVDCTCFIWILC